MDFRSDNTAPMAPEILKALIDANSGYQSSYGQDAYTQQVHKKVAEIFEHEVSIFFVSTGTAANALALSAMTHNGGIIYCHEKAHINTDESGAPSFFSGGTLHPVSGDHAKVDIQEIEDHITHVTELRPHASKPIGISISQTTEDGTMYTLNELQEIGACAKKNKLYLHMDGARFANALVALNCSPAQITWKSGVDVVSFGATKNGAMLAEMIIFFNNELAQDFDFMIKRSGQLMSKERFIAAQFLAYFKDDLWLKNARHANKMAKKLAQVFINAHMEILHEVQCNEIFVVMTAQLAQKLQAKGAQFYHWQDTVERSLISVGETQKEHVYRFVTSFVTTEKEIEQFNQILKEI